MTDPYLAQPAETGPRLLRIEARNSQTPIERKPAWIKTKLKTGPEYSEIMSLVKSGGLHTVPRSRLSEHL
jgi:lipoic acid synthetase